MCQAEEKVNRPRYRGIWHQQFGQLRLQRAYVMRSVYGLTPRLTERIGWLEHKVVFRRHDKADLASVQSFVRHCVLNDESKTRLLKSMACKNQNEKNHHEG